MAGALEGIKVASFAHFAAGPIASQTLGDLGAYVIKVESPKRDLNRYAIVEEDKLDGISPYFLAINKNVKDIVVDFKTPEGKEIALKIMEWADIVVENYRPGTLARAGLSYEDVKKINPDIIYCSCSGYGQEGPWQHRPGQDLLIQATSGLASLSGSSSSPPVPLGVYVVDGYTAMMLNIGALAALNYRDKTGEGQWVQLDMFSAVLHMCAQEATYILNLDPNPQRSKSGIAHIHQSAPYGVYETSDGSIVMSLAEPDVLKDIAYKLGVDKTVIDSITKTTSRTKRDEIASAFSAKIRKIKTEEVLVLLSDTGIWCEKVCELSDVLHDPEVNEIKGMVIEINTPYGGEYKTIKNPLKFSETPADINAPAPAWGENTIEVLTELGYSSDKIRGYVDKKAVFVDNKYNNRS